MERSGRAVFSDNMTALKSYGTYLSFTHQNKTKLTRTIEFNKGQDAKLMYKTLVLFQT